jgi:inhibitor of cysteine peptidase
MTRITVILVIGICCLCAVAFTGCISNPQNLTPAQIPTGTAIPVGNLVVNDTQNNATVSMTKGNFITVRLAENPTTGFQWNLTTTPGLSIVSDEYVPSDTSGKLVGSGGTHIWNISTGMTGNQKVYAVYKRPWEPIAGNETFFSMTILVN